MTDLEQLGAAAMARQALSRRSLKAERTGTLARPATRQVIEPAFDPPTIKSAPSIYLAGKISQGDWRHDVVSGYCHTWTWGGWHGQVDGPSMCIDAHDQTEEWPTLPLAVCDTFNYVGPYFKDEGHGLSHTPDQHGYTLHGWNSYQGDPAPKADTYRRCLDAIQRCDLFYAWLDNVTAHGTLVEIGYALGIGKPVVLDGPHYDTSRSELWFASCTANSTFGAGLSMGDTPQASLKALAKEWKRRNAPLESEIERLLWQAWFAAGEPYELEPAHEVSAAGRNYRLDFAHLPTMLAIELDGYAYHSSKEAFIKDRERQRALTATGWTFIRFAGKEVMDDAKACAEEVASVIRSRTPS